MLDGDKQRTRDQEGVKVVKRRHNVKREKDKWE